MARWLKVAGAVLALVVLGILACRILAPGPPEGRADLAGTSFEATTAGEAGRRPITVTPRGSR